MKGLVVGMVCALTAQALVGQSAPHVRLGIVSDWTHHHVLYPDSNDDSAITRIRKDPRWLQNWYLRHPEAWWPLHHHGHHQRSRRDWSVPLSATPSTSAFEPLIDFAFTIGPDTGYGSVNTTDNGGGSFLATAGTLTITGGPDVGSYPLYPGGPAKPTAPTDFSCTTIFSTLPRIP